MMRIDHIALWTSDIERCKHFYVTYFEATAGPRYMNTTKGFESCFLSFANGVRIEVMRTTSLRPVSLPPGTQRMGLTHFAVSTGSERKVDELSQRLLSD